MSNSNPFNVPMYGFNDVIDTKRLKKQTKKTKVKKSTVKKITQNKLKQSSTDINTQAELSNQIGTTDLNQIGTTDLNQTEVTDINQTDSKPKKIKKTRVKRKTNSTQIQRTDLKHVDKLTETNELTNSIESTNPTNELTKPTKVKSVELIEPKPTNSTDSIKTKPNTFNVMIDVSNIRECRCSLCNSVIQDNPVKATKFTGDIILTQQNQPNNLMFCDLLCARLYDTNVNHISINFNDYRMSYIKRQLSKKARSIYEKCADKLLTQLIVCKFSININEHDETNKINYINTLKNDLLSKL